MSRPRFLADEDLRHSIVQAIRGIEPELAITTVFEAGLASVADDEVLQYAWQHHLLLLSHDVNTMTFFAEQRIADENGICGLFLVPQSRPHAL